jgi:hypothetical protein
MDTDFELAHRRADGSIDIEFYKLRAARLRSKAAHRFVRWEKVLPLAPYVLAVFVGLAAGVSLPIPAGECMSCHRDSDGAVMQSKSQMVHTNWLNLTSKLQ